MLDLTGPLILNLDLEEHKFKRAEDLLPYLKDHILAIQMGQLRDILERERLSRGLCRHYKSIFDAHDIVVLPKPLSTIQTDSRFLAPKHLAHLIGFSSDLQKNTTNPVPKASTPELNNKTDSVSSKSLLSLLRIFCFALLATLSLLSFPLNTFGAQSKSAALLSLIHSWACSAKLDKICAEWANRTPTFFSAHFDLTPRHRNASLGANLDPGPSTPRISGSFRLRRPGDLFLSELRSMPLNLVPASPQPG